MDKEKILKANGIQNIEELNITDIQSLAVKFSNDFTAKFPCHDISKEIIANSISKAKMFKADFDDNSYGKYLYENNEIYFNKDINIENPDSTIYHELIHYIQSNFSKNGKLLKMGFFSPKSLFKKEENLGLNEASVQYIASYMKSNEYTYVKYYGLEFATISEKYYPLETTLISQLLFFTGQYSLVNSSILCNDIFKETVSNIISEDNLKQISLNLDKILTSQKYLSSKYSYLANTELEENDKINLLNIIKEEKDKLRNLIISTQKIIYENSFNYHLNNIENFNDILDMQTRLNFFEDYLIKTKDDFSFEQFKDKVMIELKNKFELIEAYGNYSFAKKAEKDLSTLPQLYNFGFIKRLFNKIKLLTEISLRIRATNNLINND